MKREGALVQNGRTQGRPKHTHESEAFQKKAPSKKPFIEISVFQSVGKEGRESNGGGKETEKGKGQTIQARGLDFSGWADRPRQLHKDGSEPGQVRTRGQPWDLDHRIQCAGTMSAWLCPDWPVCGQREF